MLSDEEIDEGLKKAINRYAKRIVYRRLTLGIVSLGISCFALGVAVARLLFN